MTVAQSDGVKKSAPKLEAAKPKVQVQTEPDEEIAEPVKRVAKKPEAAPEGKKSLADVIGAWSDAE